MEFVVASASVDEHVRLEQRAPSQVHIDAGTRLAIRFDYKLEETSKDEDLWTFRLDVVIPGKEDSTAVRKHIDRALFSDDTKCHVGIDIDFVVPGTYELDYSVLAKVSRRAWKEGEDFVTVASKESTGHLTILVDEPAPDA